jgi:hypothetical protein
MPDEMPPNATPANFFNFGFCFLKAILADICDTTSDGCPDTIGRVGLADRYHSDFPNLTTTAFCG